MIGGIKNEITLGISKCAVLVVKPKNFIPSRHYKNSSFKLEHEPFTKHEFIYISWNTFLMNHLDLKTYYH